MGAFVVRALRVILLAWRDAWAQGAVVLGARRVP
jgi:hypothetical protein